MSVSHILTLLGLLTVEITSQVQKLSPLEQMNIQICVHIANYCRLGDIIVTFYSHNDYAADVVCNCVVVVMYIAIFLWQGRAWLIAQVHHILM